MSTGAWVGVSVLSALLGLKAGVWLCEASTQSAVPTPAADIRPTLEPGKGIWAMPGCPRELMDYTGTRWAPPAWGDPNCNAVIIWEPK